MVTPAELESAARRIEQRWYELVRAEQRGASQQMLEHLFGRYMSAIEDHNRCLALYEQEQRGERDALRKRSALNPHPSAIV